MLNNKFKCSRELTKHCMLLLIFSFLTYLLLYQISFGAVLHNFVGGVNNISGSHLDLTGAPVYLCAVCPLFNDTCYTSSINTTTKNGYFLFEARNIINYVFNDSCWAGAGNHSYYMIYMCYTNRAGAKVRSTIHYNYIPTAPGGYSFVGNLSIDYVPEVFYFRGIYIDGGVYEPLCCAGNTATGRVVKTGKECINDDYGIGLDSYGLIYHDYSTTWRIVDCSDNTTELPRGRRFNVSITLVDISAEADSTIVCYIDDGTGSVFNVSANIPPTIGSLAESRFSCEDLSAGEGHSINFTFGFVLNSSAPIHYDTNKGYIPWRIINCTLYSGGEVKYSSSNILSDVDRIYVHSNRWSADYSDTESDSSRALRCFSGTSHTYFDNVRNCTFEGDVQTAISLALGNQVEAKCGDGIDNDRDGLIDCEDSDCMTLYHNCGHPALGGYDEAHPRISLFALPIHALPKVLPIIILMLLASIGVSTIFIYTKNIRAVLKILPRTSQILVMVFIIIISISIGISIMITPSLARCPRNEGDILTWCSDGIDNTRLDFSGLGSITEVGKADINDSTCNNKFAVINNKQKP